jgi:hypothetical protein
MRQCVRADGPFGYSRVGTGNSAQREMIGRVPLSEKVRQNGPVLTKQFIPLVSALAAGSTLFLNRETKLCKHLYGASLSTLEVGGREPLLRGELISPAQHRLWRITAIFPS